MNQTTDVFEQRVSALGGETAELAVGSARSAELLALLDMTPVGSTVVFANNLRTRTDRLFHDILPKLGRIETGRNSRLHSARPTARKTARTAGQTFNKHPTYPNA